MARRGRPQSRADHAGRYGGNKLALTGDLADANARLQRAGVERVLRSRLREVGDGHVTVEHVWTGERRRLPCAVLVDCGYELPEETLYLARPGTPRAGDCVAPRTVLEAVLEGRRARCELAPEEHDVRAASTATCSARCGSAR